MRSRIFFAAIAVFWLVMNFLLWRSQEAAHSQIGSELPVEVVWDKILTAPDNSGLDIYDHNNNVGKCQWTVMAGEAAQVLNQSLSADYAPDGAFPQPTGYELNFEGTSSLFRTNSIHFDLHLRLATNETWQDFRLKASIRQTKIDIHAVEATQKIMVKVDDDGAIWQRTLNFSDFDHPETLLAEAGLGSQFLGLAGAAGLPLQKDTVSKTAAALHWEAHEDWMAIGHSRVKVYRLETHFFGKKFFILTSRVGEIFWVEVPNQVTFRNQALQTFLKP